MTGYASGQGADGPWRWSWEMRSVNARGLDLRLRLPEGLPGLEETLRKDLAARFSRGAIQVGLKLNREAGIGGALNRDTLAAHLAVLAEISQQAAQAGLTLSPPNANDIMVLRGVLDVTDGASAELAPRLQQDLLAGLDALARARATEGAALLPVIADHLDQIAALIAKARAAIPDARAAAQTRMAGQMQAVLDQSDAVDPDRLAQEFALIAVKADVMEELDRLTAHVAAAQALLRDAGPIGRKFDFLTQEFMREANTFCSKSSDTALTRIGLDLKAVIDQMREQIQNVE